MYRYIQKIYRWLLLPFTILLASCELVDEHLPECVHEIRFVYDMTLSGGDAFPVQVRSIDLYVFTLDGTLVKKYSEEGDALSQKDYRMKLDLPEGTYKVVAWCGMKDNGFCMETPDKLSSMTTRLMETGVTSAEDLGALWYGTQDIHIDPMTQIVHTVHLTKDTNNIRVTLQRIDGTTVSDSDFDFSIEDTNRVLNSQNIPNSAVTYKPFVQGQQTLGGADGAEAVTVAYAEFSTSRLYVGNQPRLTITYKPDGREVMNIPLLDYLTMRSAKYMTWGSQEYLDRECDYSLVFFLNDNNQWARTTIIVNGWTIRINNI